MEARGYRHAPSPALTSTTCTSDIIEEIILVWEARDKLKEPPTCFIAENVD
jgi:hypothetical protein